MRILYGTGNRAKLDSMRRMTAGLGLEIIGLKDLEQPLPVIAESGKDPIENARLKAEAYYQAFGMPVFSCDSGLYFDGIEDDLQPGIHVRRVGGRELTDEEMIEYYADMATKHGGKLLGRYRNAICFIVDDTHRFFSMDPSLSTETFLLIGKAHTRRNPGFPLDSLSVDVTSGQYYYDMEERTVDQTAIEQGFKSFFEMALAQL